MQNVMKRFLVEAGYEHEIQIQIKEDDLLILVVFTIIAWEIILTS